jgi:hypothetical protein
MPGKALARQGNDVDAASGATGAAASASVWRVPSGRSTCSSSQLAALGAVL